MTALVLDAGALIALDRNDRSVWAMLRNAADDSAEVSVPAGVIAQAWRDGGRKALLARALGHCDEVPLDGPLARATGLLCGCAGTADIVDASRRPDRGRSIAERSGGPGHLRPHRPPTLASDARRVSPPGRRLTSSDQSRRDSRAPALGRSRVAHGNRSACFGGGGMCGAQPGCALWGCRRTCDRCRLRTRLERRPPTPTSS